MNTFNNYPKFLLALCIWREARGDTREGKVAVKHVILNRAARPMGPFHKCKDVVANILCPFQFSSFNRTDANAALLPNPANAGDWKAWEECCAVVDEDTADPTGGANFYFATGSKVPDWADPEKATRRIGAHTFYKL